MKKTVIWLAAAAMIVLLLAGCSGTGGDPVTVQSVSMITGAGSVGLAERFAGVVSARSEVKVEKDKDRTVDEIFVEAGETVTVGQILFAYDIEESQLALEKAGLEQQKIEDGIASLEKQKAELEAQLEKAKKDADKLNYTLEIQTCETNIREANYNLILQQKEVERLQAAVEGYEIPCPIDGRIQSINAEGGYDNNGNPLPFITIMEAGEYRVKGNVDESNAYSLTEGMPFIIRSRQDSSVTWHGVLAMVDWSNPVQNNNNYYYSDEMTTSSKYPFYIEMDSAEGLMLGQHVYIEPDLGQGEASPGLAMPEWYLFDIEGGAAYVWARGGNEKLEKRLVSLGEYDPELGVYMITGGLTAQDYIAYPDESCREGAPTTLFDESAFEVTDDGYVTDFDGGYEVYPEGGFTDGAEYGGEYENYDPGAGEVSETDAMPADGGIVG